MKRFLGKNIVVTGSSGFIGTHLLQYLIREDANIFIVKRNDELNPSFWTRLDLKNIDILFHLGGFTPKDSSEANSVDPIYSGNLEFTKNLLSSFPTKPKKIIFSSTLDVYDPSLSLIDENSKTNPISLYGASKLFCEQLIKSYSSNCVILRYGNVYGPGEEAYKKLIPLTINTIITNKQPCIYGDPLIQRDYIYVDDVIEATLRASLLSVSNPITLNIVSGISMSIERYILLICELMNYTNTIKYIKTNAPSFSRTFDNSKMFNLLDKWSLTPLEIGLLKEINSVIK